jgi:hypothetical protein
MSLAEPASRPQGIHDSFSCATAGSGRTGAFPSIVLTWRTDRIERDNTQGHEFRSVIQTIPRSSGEEFTLSESV